MCRRPQVLQSEWLDIGAVSLRVHDFNRCGVQSCQQPGHVLAVGGQQCDFATSGVVHSSRSD